MLYADVDGLKVINDTWGHKVGDMALEETAKILGETYRESDVIARLGGDEFAVLIMDPPDEDIEALRRRLEKKLDTVNSSGDRAFRLSLSVGLAYLDPEGSPSIDEFLVAADSSMYEHKRKKARYNPDMPDRS
jgi:diguanylate cyclase (GGDEF)-like protein